MATKKRPAKQDREKAIRARLRERLLDMMRAAHGDYNLAEPGVVESPGVLYELGPEAFGRYVAAIKHRLLPEDKQWVISLNTLATWDNFEASIDELRTLGVE